MAASQVRQTGGGPEAGVVDPFARSVRGEGDDCGRRAKEPERWSSTGEAAHSLAFPSSRVQERYTRSLVIQYISIPFLLVSTSLTMRPTLPLLAITLSLSISPASALPVPEPNTPSPLSPTSPTSSASIPPTPCTPGTFFDVARQACASISEAIQAERFSACAEGWAGLEGDDCGELREEEDEVVEARARRAALELRVESGVEGRKRKGMQKVLRVKTDEGAERRK